LSSYRRDQVHDRDDQLDGPLDLDLSFALWAEDLLAQAAAPGVRGGLDIGDPLEEALFVRL
jgi:hypothetical protein